MTTTSRSIHGATGAHRKYAGICSDCITPEERQEMVEAIGGAIVRSARK